MFKTDIAYENWNRKYRYGNETEIQTWERVAKALADTEKEPQKWYELFLNTIVKFDKDKNPIGLKCTPGGRITANIGTGFKGATLSNCFVSGPVSGATVKYTRKSSDGSISYPVEYNTSENPDDLLNIFLTIMEQAKTLASEGGYGIEMGWIRPRGSLIKGTGIRHPGVVAYLKIWDAVAECIVKGDQDGYADKIKNYLGEEKFEELKQTIKKETRRGAMLSSLPVSHPDIEEYVRAKQTSGVLTKFNMSVLMDDLFLDCVEKDEMYELEFKGKVYKKVKARDIYNLIMESCYNRAEPGVLFYDNMQRNNPVAYAGKVSATNPCFSGDMYLMTEDGCGTFKYYAEQ
jgi:ribonucleoside-diphosphate reductase alpha chain